MSGGQGGEVQPLVRLIAERNSQVEVLSPLTNWNCRDDSVIQRDTATSRDDQTDAAGYSLRRTRAV